MANKTRAQLQATIDANIPDNTTELITPALHREVETDLKDSNFNKLDDTAFDVSYTPTTSGDWDVTIPTNDGDGLDQLASRVRTIENSLPVQYTIELYANTDSTVSNIFPLYGVILLFGSVNKSSKVTSVSYETSTDGGDTWTPHADFTALDTYLTANSTPTSFILVRGIFTFLGGYIGEQAITLNYTQS